MPKHGNSAALKNTHFIFYLHRHVFFCCCTIQDVYLKCLACKYFPRIYNLHSFLPSFSLDEPNYKPLKNNLQYKSEQSFTLPVGVYHSKETFSQEKLWKHAPRSSFPHNFIRNGPFVCQRGLIFLFLNSLCTKVNPNQTGVNQVVNVLSLLTARTYISFLQQ